VGAPITEWQTVRHVSPATFKLTCGPWFASCRWDGGVPEWWGA
jgi:hypothetical protein